MKVLKKQKPNNKWKMDLECTGFGNPGKGCGSLLRVKFDDLVKYPGVPGDTWGSRDPAVSFRCPVCEKCTDLGVEHWPVNHKELPEVGAAWYKVEFKRMIFDSDSESK
jgi:hypothetical protein